MFFLFIGLCMYFSVGGGVVFIVVGVLLVVVVVGKFVGV